MNKVEGKCKYCGLEFTEEDYKNAEEGVAGDECLVGDYDDICYPCQFKMDSEKQRFM